MTFLKELLEYMEITSYNELFRKSYEKLLVLIAIR